MYNLFETPKLNKKFILHFFFFQKKKKYNQSIKSITKTSYRQYKCLNLSSFFKTDTFYQQVQDYEKPQAHERFDKLITEFNIEIAERIVRFSVLFQSSF